MSDAATEIFGLFDGLCSLLGAILSLALFGDIRTLRVAALAGAVGSGASMASGEWLADSEASMRRALIMGAATLAGCAAPAVPFFITLRWPAFVACGLIVLALVCAIAELRPGARLPSYARTLGVLAVSTLLALGAGAAGS